LTDTDARRAGLVTRLYERLPGRLGRGIRVFAWLSLLSHVLIVGTGGAVRLTGSGLGCPTWPQCTTGSLVAVPEMGIHGAIEFGNRLLTFVLIVIAAVTFLLVVRSRRRRPDLFTLSLVLGFGIIAQAIIGGITVLTTLDPNYVQAHFLVSVVLVALATVLVFRVYVGPRGSRRAAPLWLIVTAHLASFAVAVTVFAGALTTGSGPHSGDDAAARNGLDPELMQHVHSWPAYVALALTLVLVVGSRRLPASLEGTRPSGRNASLARYSLLLLAVELVQVVVGITQARFGLPELLVGIHMVLSCVLVSAMTAVVLSLREPAGKVTTPSDDAVLEESTPA
jgi:cytochrome c oxidase assembly protein subunit 15